MASILVLNGPNLNLLGTREPEIYGPHSLNDINSELSDHCHQAGHHIQFLQSNAEYELIDRVHDANREGINFIIINPGALTHTSIALRDALLGAAIPFIEVHLSNIHGREAFRQHSYLADIAVGTIVGLGPKGYHLALQAAFERLN